MSYYALVESRTKDLHLLDSEYILNESFSKRRFKTVKEAMRFAKALAERRVQNSVDLAIIHIRVADEVDRGIYTTPYTAIEVRKGDTKDTFSYIE